jgi:3-oxoacyl-[acyl-carrier protein] reductase
VHIAVFGSTGFLGQEICKSAKSKGWIVSPVLNSLDGGSSLAKNDFAWLEHLSDVGKLDGVVWAQGRNGSGTVLSTSTSELEDLMEANITFVASTLKLLVDKKLLNKPCRSVVLGSVWQNLARTNKFAYTVSKSAVAGLVGSIASDMSDYGLSINAVLPGVVDSPMTRAHLSSPSLERIQSESLGGELVSAKEVADVVAFLISANSSGINGQSIVVDHGWSKARHVEP